MRFNSKKGIYILIFPQSLDKNDSPHIVGTSFPSSGWLPGDRIAREKLGICLLGKVTRGGEEPARGKCWKKIPLVVVLSLLRPSRGGPFCLHHLHDGGVH